MRRPARRFLAAVAGVFVAVSVSAQQPDTTPPVPLVFVGATAEGYKLTRPARDFSSGFRIDRTDAARSNLDVEIVVPPLVAPNTNAVPITMTIGGQVITGKASIPPDGALLMLTAILPEPLTYTSQIKISAPSRKSLVVPLQIVRSRVATSLEFKDLDTVPGATGDPIVATFTLRETSGQKTTFYTPDLSGLARIVATKRLQASSSQLPTVSRFKSDGTVDVLKANQTLDIDGGATERFTIALAGLPDAGEYGGTLHVTSPDGTTIDQAVTLLVHDSVGLAVALILAGVVLSMWLRYYYQTKRPEIVRSHTALEVLKQLDEIATRPGVTDPAKVVVQSLADRVQRANERIRIGEGESADTVVTDVRGKLELLRKWIDAVKIVTALGSSPVAPPLRRKLDDVRVVLLNTGATDVGAALTTVLAIPGDIQTALAADFNKTLGALEGALAKLPGGAGHAPAAQAAIVEVEHLIDRAKQTFNAGNLDEARALVTGARKQFVVVLADEMKTAIAGVPLGYDAAGWTPIAAEIGRLLDDAKDDADLDRAWNEYNAARREYVRHVLRGLRRESGTLTAILTALSTQNPNNPTVKAVTPILEPAAASIAGAQQVLDTDVDAAYARTQDGDQAIRAARKALEDRGVQMSVGAQAIAAFFRPAGVPALATIDSPDALAALPVEPAIALADLRRTLQFWDILVSAVIAAIAVFLGMKTLLFGSLTWGGWADWATAFLWGLGMHQFSFDGVNTLAQKFSK
jgi:hypothetical protein